MLLALLAKPDLRLTVGLAALLLSGLAVNPETVGPREAALFQTINSLPDALQRPVWVVMQSGSLAMVPVTSAACWAAGHRDVATRLAGAGSATWLLAKLVKRVYRRSRPSALVAGTRCRGREATGLGYVSGHAGVAVALSVTAAPVLGRLGRRAVLVAVPVVGLSRIYVGAHLPLDVAGGAALGLAVAGLVDAVASHPAGR